MAEIKVEKYPCEVREVFSGDDLVALVDLGVENLWKKQRIRLHGVDAPNAIKAGPETDAGKIRQFVRNMTLKKRGQLYVVSKTMNSWVVVLEVQRDNTNQFLNVNEILIAQGYVYKPTATAGTA